MISALISLLIAGLVLWLIFFIVGKFVTGTPLQIIGIILALVFLLIALDMFDVAPWTRARPRPVYIER